MSRGPLFCLSILVLVACGDHPDPAGVPHPVPPGAAPLAAISDAAHDPASPSFYWLPPLVPAPTPAGVFDSALLPHLSVEVCLLGASGCDFVRRFAATGQGAQAIRLSDADEHYLVNWNTREDGVEPGHTYRVAVVAFERELGFVDVAVVRSRGEAGAVDGGSFVPVVAGQTLPIKFRPERGAVARHWVGVSSSWSDPANWLPAGAPMALDAVHVLAGAAVMPVLESDLAVAGVHVEGGASLHVQSHTLTVTGDVEAAGAIAGAGVLALTGAEATLSGAVPSLRMTGTTSLSGATTVVGHVAIAGGRLSSAGHLLRIVAP